MAKERPAEQVEVRENDTVRISIIPRYCKGCEICVKLCPVQALGMERFKSKVMDIDKCVLCMQCEMRCPDFAISVERKEPAP